VLTVIRRMTSAMAMMPTNSPASPVRIVATLQWVPITASECSVHNTQLVGSHVTPGPVSVICSAADANDR
jgi:hypothetical protein